MLPERWQNLPEPARAALAERLDSAVLRAGKPIYDEGDEAERLYVVGEGCVRLFRVAEDGREVTVDVAESGSLFGAAALAAAARYTTYAETISRARVCSLHRESLEPLWRRYPSLRRLLLGELARSLRSTQNFYAQQRFAEVPRRLARVLLLHMKPGSEGIEVDLSHQQIGYLIGANRDTVTRNLGELAQEGLLEINYHRILVLDAEALRRLAGEPVGEV